MTRIARALQKMTAVLLLPLAFFVGSASAVDLMSCRTLDVVQTNCCCTPPAAHTSINKHPHLEQDCCKHLTLTTTHFNAS